MQYDLSTLTRATRDVFDAVHYLGQGNVHELMEQSGKARSTVDKAIKQLADARLIVPVDSDADAAEGVPTRWTMAEGVAESITFDTDTELAASDTAGDDEAGIGDDATEGQAPADDQPGITPEADADADADAVDSAEDESADDSDESPDDDHDGDDIDDTDEADEADDTGTDDDSDYEDDDEDEPAQGTARVTVVQPSRPGDRKVMAIKGVLAEFGDDGATLDEIVAESGIGHPTASRLLTAMEQADAARRLPGTPGRWIAGPTKASDVDPNPEPPRCPVCFQVVKGLAESPEAVAQIMPLIRPDGTLHVVAEDGTAHVVTLPKRMPTRTTGFATAGTVRRTDVTVNADGSQPFGKGDLERLTFETLKANPGRTMTPQDIATAISAQLGGRAVSSGAVRNNCGKLGSAGRILMVSESPWSFQFPTPAEDNGSAEQADDASDKADDATSQSGEVTGQTDASGVQS
ncbi:DNA-binding MarR family transcriptional regulator [Allocatelliglobosispora scoriae]|uniref:DNA-binding MarR family transcriptional regulator n=1 Tax=Allocatelliglobosispora scoriae TaxID=643052 RepID=A0A841BYE1_9ACTN|nr:MarR family transcriptional regulator [Allocatelliglobosispora scoriae]MBB5871943.1 DNA-binding MarR family transcriptional regulator [Allocatelliglobosispora scoriae]